MTYLHNRRKFLQPARRKVFLGKPDSPAHASTKMIRVPVRPPGLPTEPANSRKPRPMAILPLPLEPRDPFGVEHDTRTELLGHQGQPVQRLEPFTPLPDNIQLVYVGDALVPVLDLVESDDKFLCPVRQGDVIQEAVGGEPKIKSRLEHFRHEYCYDLHEKIRDVG